MQNVCMQSFRPASNSFGPQMCKSGSIAMHSANHCMQQAPRVACNEYTLLRTQSFVCLSMTPSQTHKCFQSGDRAEHHPCTHHLTTYPACCVIVLCHTSQPSIFSIFPFQLNPTTLRTPSSGHPGHASCHPLLPLPGCCWLVG